MCKKKDKTRQSDAKISLMSMIKFKEWWCKLHVEQLAIKEAWKKHFRPPVEFPPIIFEMLQLANTPPIVRLQEPYLARAGKTNVEIKILTQGETIMLAKLLIKNTWLVEFMRIKHKYTGGRQEFYVPESSPG